MRELVIALLATLAIQTLTSVAVFTPAILAPAASGDIGVAASAIGAFTAAIYFLASLSAPIGGSFVARYGAVRVSQACLVLAGIGLALCGLTHPVAVIAGAVLIGSGYGPPTPVSSTLLVERTPDRLRNLIMSIRQTGVPVGGAIAGIVGRVLWGAAADFFGNARTVLALLGAVMALCVVTTPLISSAWPFGAVVLLCVVFGATAIGWNGVYVAEIARIAPGGNVAIATGASLALTYLGVAVGPFVFWLIVTLTGSYGAAFGSAALVTLAAAVSILRRTSPVR